MKSGVKVILVGDSTVGKTTLLRALSGANLNEPISPTMAAAFTSIPIENPATQETFTFNLWDTAGQEAYRSLIKVYFRSIQVAILVYDITNRETFDKIDEWINDIDNNSGNDTYRLIIVGNKIDRGDERQVKEEELLNKAKHQGARYIEVSALSQLQTSCLKDMLLSVYLDKHSSRAELMKQNENEPSQTAEPTLEEKNVDAPIISLTDEKKKKRPCCKE